MTAPGFSEWDALPLEARRCAAAAARARALRLEPSLRAYVAIADAAKASPSGALAFMPYAAKDLFAAPGHRPAAGLAQTLDFDLAEHAEVLRRLDAAGACRVGFTALPELAYEPSGCNEVCPFPRNPWNFDVVPGGSSSGSAVAVASGSAAIALGSDTGGSLRIPAHCCGVTAWKPTWGRVPAAGAVPLAPSLDAVGLLARAAADLRQSAAVLMASKAAKAAPIASVVALTDAIEAADADVAAACRQGLDAIRACDVAVTGAAGLPAIEAIDAHALLVLQGEAARVHAARIDHPALGPTVRRRLQKGLAIDDATLAASRDARVQLSAAFADRVLGKTDAAVLPVMPIATPRVAEVDPSSSSFSARRLYALGRYCRFVNMLGWPAVALPAGFDRRGLPVGLQIIGRPDRDRDLIDLAVAVQRRTDWHGRVPAAIGDVAREPERAPG